MKAELVTNSVGEHRLILRPEDETDLDFLNQVAAPEEIGEPGEPDHTYVHTYLETIVVSHRLDDDDDNEALEYVSFGIHQDFHDPENT